ncbi:hypothetical protein BaOVIS_026330 [Babesia ovis]|uniref:Uncharacterized protein n=1 Tax=Babesia ovis TaxID=5869 RepID=A0A9W5WVU2_BABOV|nr:hypothetical protein BaOVIS_026330 [Babesia ovis]
MFGLYCIRSLVRSSRCIRAFTTQNASANITAKAVTVGVTRTFSSLSTSVTESAYHKDFVTRAKAAYGGKQEVDAAMSEMLSSHRLVLFMEGSLDHPKSLCAGNLSKIFTALQITGLHTVDLLGEPEIMGYLCTHLQENVRNVLFKDGAPLLDYDHILELFKKGTLLQALEVKSKPAARDTNKHFKDMLPIANY